MHFWREKRLQSQIGRSEGLRSTDPLSRASGSGKLTRSDLGPIKKMKLSLSFLSSTSFHVAEIFNVWEQFWPDFQFSISQFSICRNSQCLRVTLTRFPCRASSCSGWPLTLKQGNLGRDDDEQIGCDDDDYFVSEVILQLWSSWCHHPSIADKLLISLSILISKFSKLL